MKAFSLGLTLMLAVASCSGSKTALNTAPISCAEDADCPTSVCDGAQHVCVQCMADHDCGAGSSCVSQVCTSTTCVPDGARCSTDGKQLLVCTHAGDSEVPVSCGSSQLCVADAQGAQCSTGSCTPGALSCSGATLVVCNPDAATFSTSQVCGSGQYCDARKAECLAQICTPGASQCNGANVELCNDAGSDVSVMQTCSLTQQCQNGACVEIACVPNTRFCNGGEVWQCSGDGTTSTLATHCSGGEFCLEKSPSAECSPTQCTPNDPVCAGTLASVCASDGSSPMPGGDDCSLSGQICFGGTCLDQVCTPGQKLCDHGDVYLCAQSGTSTALLSTCADGEACDAESGTCKPTICTPGTLGCDTTRVITCAESGVSWDETGPDCSASGQVCDTGACKDVICTPGYSYCQNNGVTVCNALGTGGKLSQACASSYYCQTSGSYAYCAYQVCTPDAAACSGTRIGTCKSDGSGVTPGATDCATTGQLCSAGKCVDQVCTPSTYFCSSGNAYYCDYTGLIQTLYKTCTTGTHCAMSNGYSTCVPTACVPNATACVAEKLGKCATDGMSISSVTTDCSGSTQVCTLQGCASSALDPIGSATDINASNTYLNMVGDVIQVDTPRQLTTIEAQLDLPASRSLQWVVFQLSGNYFLLKSQTVTTASGTGIQSSGAISQELVAGGVYLIGVYVTNGSFAYYSSSTTPAQLTFGTARGSFAGAYASTLNDYESAAALYYFRLTTQAP